MKHGNNRNPQLIRNLIGKRAHESVIRVVEKVHELGVSSFASRITQMFNIAPNDVRYIADVSVWVIRVLPDNATVWVETLMAEYDRVKYQNPIYVHAMLIALMETSAAFAALPSDSSSDGEDFEKKLHTWLAKLLVDGKPIVLYSNHQEAIRKAIKAFVKHHLVKYRMCDTMQTIIAADDKHRWAPVSVAEFVIREIAEAMVGRVYDEDEVIFALSKYREGRKF